MKSSDLSRYVFGLCAAASILGGCSGGPSGYAPGAPAASGAQTASHSSEAPTLPMALKGSAASTDYVQSGGYVYWSPPSRSPASYEDYAWKFAIEELPINTADYWYSIQDTFAGSTTDGFDMGYQTYTPGGLVIFNFIGKDVISAAQNCEIDITQGITTCPIAYTLTVGHLYELKTTETTNVRNNTEKWTGTVTDVFAHTKPTTIGSWTIPLSDGGLSAASGISFAYDLGTPPNCAQEPYQKVNMEFPQGYSRGSVYTSKVGSTGKAQDCASNTHFTQEAHDILVQTGKLK